MNQVGLHICCVGNYDLIQPADRMLDVLVRRIIVPWCDRYDIDVNNVKGHRNYATYKSCPGTQFDLDKLRQLCRENL